MAYLLDANVFIQAKNLHCGLDFCPAFWDWLVERNAAGEVFSIERVGDEIEAGGDELADWTAQRGSDFFLKPDAAILAALPSVSAWVTAQRYEPAAVNTFLQVADYYLVAHALAHGHTVVTHEKASTSTKKVKIPEPCIGLGIKCMTPFEVLRRERARFVLGTAR
jgi:predicted nucleic acid-binding protein